MLLIQHFGRKEGCLIKEGIKQEILIENINSHSIFLS
jgi:hypothetical protein